MKNQRECPNMVVKLYSSSFSHNFSFKIKNFPYSKTNLNLSMDLSLLLYCMIYEKALFISFVCRHSEIKQMSMKL